MDIYSVLKKVIREKFIQHKSYLAVPANKDFHGESIAVHYLMVLVDLSGIVNCLNLLDLPTEQFLIFESS